MATVRSSLVTSHVNPPTAGRDRSAEWGQATSFPEWLPTAEKNPELWESVWRRANVPSDLLERAEALSGPWYLLVLSADWCGDASNTVPVLARLAEQAPGLALRVIERDDHLPLMDEHLTGGTARAIPAVLILDANHVERAWWGPRPAELQAWVKGEGQTYGKDARYKEVRRWYARDKGRSTLQEVISLIEATSLRKTIS